MNAPQANPRFSINTLAKYPFLNASITWMRQQDINPMEGLYAHVTMLDRIRDLVSDALENKETTESLRPDSEVTLYLYPWLRIILSIMGIPRLVYKVANLVSKHYGIQLDREDPLSLRMVALDQGFKVDAVPKEEIPAYKTVSFPFKIQFLDYLTFVSKFKAPPWKLVNRLLTKGQVYLRSHDIARMIEEHLKEKTMEITKIPIDDGFKKAIDADPLVKPFIDRLVATTNEKLEAAGMSGTEFSGPVDDSAFPPCINFIIDKNQKGVNLAHTERLFFVFFLLTIGKTTGEVVDLFRNQPDFNEKITVYQVEFAAGKQGKKTQYKPHNCMTLQSLGICKKDDPAFGSEFCASPKFPFKNPLTFYNRMVKWKAKRADGQGQPPVEPKHAPEATK
nr:hypothetical protein [Candidatus Sigynarchaeota archaeon]